MINPQPLLVTLKNRFMQKACKKCNGTMEEIFCTSIMKNGKRILPIKAKYFHFFVCKKCKSNI